jgi:hypothetical protein
MSEKKFSFGSEPNMREVPPGTEAKFQFTEKPSVVDTEWGEKIRFPILLYSHDSYDSLPIKCNWESKSQVAKELLEAHTKGDNKDFLKAYKDSKWQLTRFDSGSYWIDQL